MENSMIPIIAESLWQDADTLSMRANLVFPQNQKTYSDMPELYRTRILFPQAANDLLLTLCDLRLNAKLMAEAHGAEAKDSGAASEAEQREAFAAEQSKKIEPVVKELFTEFQVYLLRKYYFATNS